MDNYSNLIPLNSMAFGVIVEGFTVNLKHVSVLLSITLQNVYHILVDGTIEDNFCFKNSMPHTAAFRSFYKEVLSTAMN